MFKVVLFKGSFSFVNELNENGIKYQSFAQRSIQPQASGQVLEIVQAVSDAMPWNALAKVMISYLQAKASREIMITGNDGQIFHARGYSVSELEKILSNARDAHVVDTKPD